VYFCALFSSYSATLLTSQIIVFPKRDILNFSFNQSVIVRRHDMAYCAESAPNPSRLAMVLCWPVVIVWIAVQLFF